MVSSVSGAAPAPAAVVEKKASTKAAAKPAGGKAIDTAAEVTVLETPATQTLMQQREECLRYFAVRMHTNQGD